MKHFGHLILVIYLCCFILLSGCYPFSSSPISSGLTNKYTLNVTPKRISKTSNRSIVLLVTQPETASVFDTNEMAYSTQRYKIAYFIQNQWAAAPSEMLQSLMVQSLRKTGYFDAVLSPPTLGSYEFLLVTQLVELKQIFYRQKSGVSLVIHAQLINARNGQIIAEKDFSDYEMAPYRTPYGGVIAANRATSKFLNQMTRFCLRYL